MSVANTVLQVDDFFSHARLLGGRLIPELTETFLRRSEFPWESLQPLGQGAGRWSVLSWSGSGRLWFVQLQTESPSGRASFQLLIRTTWGPLQVLQVFRTFDKSVQVMLAVFSSRKQLPTVFVIVSNGFNALLPKKVKLWPNFKLFSIDRIFLLNFKQR